MNQGAKSEILARIQTALGDRPAPGPISRDYRPAGSNAVDIELFIDRLVDYRATVHRHASPDIAVNITEILLGRGRSRIAVPDGFPDEWLPEAELLREPLTVSELNEADGALTTCAVGIAETGTIVLDAGPGQGRRALSLVPDYHLLVIRTDQVVAIVPDAVALLKPERPLTWISGPSATSDIELKRVEGVHGPRTLDILLLD